MSLCAGSGSRPRFAHPTGDEAQAKRWTFAPNAEPHYRCTACERSIPIDKGGYLYRHHTTATRQEAPTIAAA